MMLYALTSKLWTCWRVTWIPKWRLGDENLDTGVGALPWEYPVYFRVKHHLPVFVIMRLNRCLPSKCYSNRQLSVKNRMGWHLVSGHWSSCCILEYNSMKYRIEPADWSLGKTWQYWFEGLPCYQTMDCLLRTLLCSKIHWISLVTCK